MSWISVKERMPDISDGIVLLWLTKGAIPEFVLGGVLNCYSDKGLETLGVIDYNNPSTTLALDQFTHWMKLNPLPEPPKEKG